jgi:hypothetical protein
MDTEKETRITIRFPSDLVDDIKKLAKTETRSINSEVVYALREYVRQKRKEIKRNEPKNL